MKSGIKPSKPDYRDYDYLKSHHFGLTHAPSFPKEFNLDAGFGCPNQELPNTLFTPPIPAMPYGCTNYSQAELCQNEDMSIYNPEYIEEHTHANAQGGIDIKISLKSVIKDGLQRIDGIVGFNRTAYFNIRGSGLIDYFDAVRLAMYSSLPEKRAISLGTPYFSEWARTGTDGILPLPSFDVRNVIWHNGVIVGWKEINGTPYLIYKSHQGENFGDKGFAYFSRELYNSVMNIKGSVAYTLSKVAPNQILTVDLGVVQTIMSFIRNLFNL